MNQVNNTLEKQNTNETFKYPPINLFVAEMTNMKHNLTTLLKDWKKEAELTRNEHYMEGIWYCIHDLKELRKELLGYINFVEGGLRSHGKPKEVTIKYKIYKELLGK